MVELKGIGVLSLAKVYGSFMGILGLLIGLFVATIDVFLSSIMGTGSGMGFLAIIILPVMYGVFGFIIGAIGALLYNLIAGWIGGLELDLKQ